MTFVCKNSFGFKEDVESVIVRIQCVPPKLYRCGNGRSSAVLAAITVCNQRLFIPTKVALYTFNNNATGGMVLGGIADVDSDEAFNEFGSGGSLVAGLSSNIISINILGSAGIEAAGDNDINVISDIEGINGSVIGGASENGLILCPACGGMGGSAGTADVQYVANPPTGDEGAEDAGVADESVV